MNIFVEQVIRAAKLDATLYEEVEHDPGAMRWAMAVVVLSSVAAGVGSLRVGVAGLLVGAAAAMIGWFLWAYITYFVGTRLFAETQTHADPGQLLRTIGFSSAPGLIRALGVIPGAREIVFLVASLWMLAAMVVAVRQALDYTSTWRAVGVCAVGWMVQALIFGGVLFLLRSLA